MKKKIDKKKIVKYAGAGLLTAALAAGVGLHIYDSKIDHLTEYCPINDLFNTLSMSGGCHQIDKINKDYLAYGIRAYEGSDGEVVLTSDPIVQEIDGIKYYVLPTGYKLYDDGHTALKAVGLDTDADVIVITQGIPMFPEGSEPGDIVKRSDIGIYDPQIISTIDVPKKTR